MVTGPGAVSIGDGANRIEAGLRRREWGRGEEVPLAVKTRGCHLPVVDLANHVEDIETSDCEEDHLIDRHNDNSLCVAGVLKEPAAVFPR
jgi:hypothetical protein